MQSEKSSVRVVRHAQLQFSPRFEYGDMAQVAGVCGDSDGSELGVGWGRLENARIPWTIRYDEVLTVFAGHLNLHVNGKVHDLGVSDCIWLPDGTELIYEAKPALIHFAIHPTNWQSVT